MRKNNGGNKHVTIQEKLVDNRTGLKERVKRRGGGEHKGSLFSGRDKSEVSFWIFNILQGTKQSYSGLVSGTGGWRGAKGLLSVSVDGCMLLSDLLCGFA